MRSQKSEPLLTTFHLDEIIEIFRGPSGYYFLCGSKSVRWGSCFDFAEPIEALNMAFLHQQCDQVDDLDIPAAIFSLETGRILHTNPSHFCWLGHRCLQMDRDTILSRVVSPERVASRILPIGTRTVGVYEISNALQAYQFKFDPTSWESLWESVTAFNGFAHYGVKSQEILSHWVDLGNTPEFYRQYLRDLGRLDKLRGIA